VIPAFSVEAAQVNVICVLEVATAIRFIGAVGGVGSAAVVEFGVFTDALQP
jgi:hypothetical protein